MTIKMARTIHPYFIIVWVVERWQRGSAQSAPEDCMGGLG
jgi:hypothetical protein